MIFALIQMLHRFLVYDRISEGFPAYFVYIFYYSVQREHEFKPTLSDVNLAAHAQTWNQCVGIELLQINMHELCQ